VVGIVVPWNFPIAMTVQPMICALAAGNRVMVKMSENSAHLARLLQSLLPRYFAADKVSLFQDAGSGWPERRATVHAVAVQPPVLHRLAADRQGRDGQLRRQPYAGDAGAGRQVARHRRARLTRWTRQPSASCG
jgi:hypothetical protein